VAVEYRLMRAEEERVVLGMWGEPAYQAARLATDPAARAHTYVAAAPDGSILSALHYLVTVRRDAAGAPRRVGEIDSVVTVAAARRQGHATRLVRLALEALRAAGCDWSLLVATAEGRPLYERHGWRCYPERWRRGTVTGALPDGDGRYAVRPLDPQREPAGWDRIAAVDVAFNRERPLTVVRDAAYWRGYAAWRVGNWIADEGLVIFGAFRREAEPRLCGFAFAEYYPPAFQVRDLGVLPDAPGAAAALLAAVAAEASRRGIPPAGRLYLPEEPAIDAALDRLFGPTLHAGQDEGQLMARPIAADFAERELDAIFDAPGAHFSAIDVF
jgi:GNAT superfamily N-acetyltransferase